MKKDINVSEINYSAQMPLIINEGQAKIFGFSNKEIKRAKKYHQNKHTYYEERIFTRYK